MMDSIWDGGQDMDTYQTAAEQEDEIWLLENVYDIEDDFIELLAEIRIR